MSNKVYSFEEMLDEYSQSRKATAKLLRMWFDSEEERVKAQREVILRKDNENYWRKEAEKFERLWDEERKKERR